MRRGATRLADDDDDDDDDDDAYLLGGSASKPSARARFASGGTSAIGAARKLCSSRVFFACVAIGLLMWFRPWASSASEWTASGKPAAAASSSSSSLASAVRVAGGGDGDDVIVVGDSEATSTTEAKTNTKARVAAVASTAAGTDPDAVVVVNPTATVATDEDAGAGGGGDEGEGSRVISTSSRVSDGVVSTVHVTNEGFAPAPPPPRPKPREPNPRIEAALREFETLMKGKTLPKSDVLETMLAKVEVMAHEAKNRAYSVYTTFEQKQRLARLEAKIRHAAKGSKLSHKLAEVRAQRGAQREEALPRTGMRTACARGLPSCPRHARGLPCMCTARPHRARARRSRR